MNLTRDLLKALDACAEGYRYVLEHNLLNIPYDDAINAMRQDIGNADAAEYADWLEDQKKTEIYFRAYGGAITMGAYQVYNCYTGQHQRYETEEEAKTALLEITKNLILTHGPRITRELINENGDAIWLASDINERIQLSLDANEKVEINL